MTSTFLHPACRKCAGRMGLTKIMTELSRGSAKSVREHECKQCGLRLTLQSAEQLSEFREPAGPLNFAQRRRSAGLCGNDVLIILMASAAQSLQLPLKFGKFLLQLRESDFRVIGIEASPTEGRSYFSLPDYCSNGVCYACLCFCARRNGFIRAVNARFLACRHGSFFS
jgi:hypothetical protein